MNASSAAYARESSQTEPRTLVESAYRALRHDIIEGALSPGEKLRVEHLKDNYNVGAGTLREALSLLISDALVINQGQRGFRVAPVSIEDFADITRMRVMLECEALRQSITSGDDAWEGEVLAAFHRLTKAETREIDSEGRKEWEERNRIFHEVLISASPSRWLKHFLSILYRQAERYRRISLYQRPIHRELHTEHEALLKAVMARDADKAVSILAEHIQLTFESFQLIPEDQLNSQQ